MKIALSVIKLSTSIESNLEKVINQIRIAANNKADIIFFAETTLSGLIPNDNVSEILPLAIPIPGPLTNSIANICNKYNIWTGIGLLEKSECKLYDSAVLISPKKEIELKYRRISPCWHWPSSPPEFCEGTIIPVANTPFGKISSLICGDLFNEQNQIEKLKKNKPDFVYLPVVRSGESGKNFSQLEWDSCELPAYKNQVKKIGAPTFLVNYIDESYFGGATVFDYDGTVLTSQPLWKEGIIYHNFTI